MMNKSDYDKADRVHSFNRMVAWIALTAKVSAFEVYNYLVTGNSDYLDEYKKAQIEELKMEWMLD